MPGPSDTKVLARSTSSGSFHNNFCRGITLKSLFACVFFIVLALFSSWAAPATAMAQSSAPPPVVLSNGWQLQDVAKATQGGAEIAAPELNTSGWYPASVPATVLTTLVNNHVYPEPLYGENNRTEVIPESFAHTSYWERGQMAIP